jgi:hypothetical protein
MISYRGVMIEFDNEKSVYVMGSDDGYTGIGTVISLCFNESKFNRSHLAAVRRDSQVPKGTSLVTCHYCFLRASKERFSALLLESGQKVRWKFRQSA